MAGAIASGFSEANDCSRVGARGTPKSVRLAGAEAATRDLLVDNLGEHGSNA